MTPDERFDHLAHMQFLLENSMVDRGGKRFHDQRLKNLLGDRESTGGSARRLLLESLEKTTVGLQAFLDATVGRVGRQHCAVRIITEVGAEATAYLTAKTVIDTISSKTTVMRLCMKIALMLLDELRYRRFEQACPGLFNWKMKHFNTTSYVHMKRSLDASINFANVDVSEYALTDSHKLLLGAKCFDIFHDTTHYVEVIRIKRKDTQETNVVATQDTLDWLDRCDASLEFRTPIYMPTLIPPLPWSNMNNGGYWFKLRGKFALLRSGRHHLEDLSNVEMPVVYEAINALQNTSWLINERVLSVVDEMKARGNVACGLPSYTEEPVPAKPEIMIRMKDKVAEQELEGETLEKYKAIVKKWRTKSHAVHERNHIRKAQALNLARVIATARMLVGHTDNDNVPVPFHFPHNLDFRGRAYAIPLYLQPQGDDLQKGLLQFGEGLALGSPAAADWLAIHGANCLADAPDGEKLDKQSFAARIDWIDKHTQDICDVDEDPILNDWWTHADLPFCFLAFCFEWAAYKRVGLSYVSSIPVAMDGSCNGLQHYAALLRDEQCGAEVNLIPSPHPRDIYTTVAKSVNAALAEVAQGHSPDAPLALNWLKWGRVDRKFLKRQVMTLPYGSREYGFRKQIEEYIKGVAADMTSMSDRNYVQADSKPLAFDEAPCFVDEDEDAFKHYLFMAKIIWVSLQDTVTAATEAMEFFKKLARLAGRGNLPLSWVAPNGMPIVQGYRVMEAKRINTILSGISFQPHYVEQTNNIDRNKQVSAIAPNIIHSLDASAMMLTCVAAVREGITHFAMVHDSYGTHAARAADLARITRTEFIRMYTEHDVLAELEQGLLNTLPPGTKGPIRPLLGKLNLEDINGSLYFFA